MRTTTTVADASIVRAWAALILCAAVLLVPVSTVSGALADVHNSARSEQEAVYAEHDNHEHDHGHAHEAEHESDHPKILS